MSDEPNKSGPGYYGDVLERALAECGASAGALLVMKEALSQSSVITSPALAVDIVKALRDLSDGVVRDARLAAKRTNLPDTFPTVATILALRTIDELIHEHCDLGEPIVSNVSISAESRGGKYDAALAMVREKFDITECAVIVLKGPKGPGFAVTISPTRLRGLPSVLRHMADSIEADIKKATS